MKKIEIDTFLKFQFVSNPSFSPDGKYIAFVVSNADRAEIHTKPTSTFTIWLKKRFGR